MKPALGDDLEAGDLLLGGPGLEADASSFTSAANLTGGAWSALHGGQVQHFSPGTATPIGQGTGAGGAPGRTQPYPVQKY